MSFNEARLETLYAELLQDEGYPHSFGAALNRASDEVILEDDLFLYLKNRYDEEGITDTEIQSIILQLKSLPTSDLYESNKQFMHWVSNGFILKREDRSQKDIYIELIDYAGLNKYKIPEEGEVDTFSVEEERPEIRKTEKNTYRFVTQLKIEGNHERIPDGILYINGLPMVVFEFKSAVREDATIHDAYIQLTTRYKRDIPKLFLYNAFCVVSDGVNSKAGSVFTNYGNYYAWRRIVGMEKAADGIDSMYTMIQGMFNRKRLRDIIRNFIYFPDNSKSELKVVTRYPQYYAVKALFKSIKNAQKPQGDGKGGVYFGATGSGKSFTMVFLARMLMKSEFFGSPTIVMITDRTDLDDQLSELFIKSKKYIGDDTIVSVESRADLREKLQHRPSGGVFLTTIHKFTEDTELLSKRTNIICISDEAHRSQTNLDQKVKIVNGEVVKTYGFAKYLHDSLPNATYVGFTGTPIDATLDVFGKVVDAYTMKESVADEITVSLVYEGRAAKVALHNDELKKIERYYEEAAELGANEHQIDQSKRDVTTMYTVLGDPKRLKAVAEDFVQHYEKRIEEGSSVIGKAMFVCANRYIAYRLFKEIINIRPEWNEIKKSADGVELTDKDKKELKPIERIKMVMTRGQDDEKDLYNLLGTKEDRKELDRQFKNPKSNFKIAIVVDMWLTGFDVPFLDTIYIDKPIKEHNLIQTISRVNRKYIGKEKGLVVDYIGIRKYMNQALRKYGPEGGDGAEGIEESVIIVKNHLDLLARFFHKFDDTGYFQGTNREQLDTLNKAVEFAQITKKEEKRFMDLVKRLKAAYDICVNSEEITEKERDYVHFYLAVRSIIFKLTRGNAPDTEQMNTKVREMIKDALESEGVEEIFKIGQEEATQDIFDEKYLEMIDKVKLPNTKIKLLQKLLAKAIGEIKKVNRMRGIDFTKQMETVVQRYNDREDDAKLQSEVYEEIAETLTNMLLQVQKVFTEGDELGIGFEEKAFYDILKGLCIKYSFTYPEDKMIDLAKEVKKIVDSKVKYPDWNSRDDIKSELKVDIIIKLDEFGYPPVERDEVYVEIFEQAENYKKSTL